MSNKRRILDSALKLFNENGTYAISTNHIAEHVGISPGNLYYHFRNKEEIITSLFQQMIDEWESDSGSKAVNVKVDAEQFLDLILSKMFEFVWGYRFIHRELASLLQRDEQLASYCQTILGRRVREIIELTRVLEQLGYLRSLDDETRDFLGQTALFYGLFWQPYLEVTGQNATRSNVLKSIKRIKQLLEPYRARE